VVFLISNLSGWWMVEKLSYTSNTISRKPTGGGEENRVMTII